MEERHPDLIVAKKDYTPFPISAIGLFKPRICICLQVCIYHLLIKGMVIFCTQILLFLSYHL